MTKLRSDKAVKPELDATSKTYYMMVIKTVIRLTNFPAYLLYLPFLILCVLLCLVDGIDGYFEVFSYFLFVDPGDDRDQVVFCLGDDISGVSISEEVVVF